MVKWFVYIVFLLVFTPCLLLAKNKPGISHGTLVLREDIALLTYPPTGIVDTVKTNKSQAKADLKVKEVAKAKKQPKPEKVDEPGQTDTKAKPKRPRRPEGMERPPEIPRRNDN
jgi:hypothetical protein